MSSENSIIGTSFGNYLITAEIGSGSFGNVYQGQHTILTERTVAIKRIHSHLGSPEERERFLEEARLLERLKHPHILHIFDAGIHEGFPYLVAEYAPNGSLRDRLKQYAPNLLPLPEALSILSQVGQGLYYAHQRNVIHRDLKPANILFNAQEEVLLADFGIAMTLTTSSITHAAIIGTPPYMAPEQFQGSISKESDQYALGCIAYELFTGRTPFNASDLLAMGFEHLTKQPIPPTQLNPHLPLHIERAILRALAKQRGSRHKDVKAFIMALYTPDNQQVPISITPDMYPASGPITPISMPNYSHTPIIHHNLPFSSPLNTSQAAMGQKLPENVPDTQITQKTFSPFNQTPVSPTPPFNSSFHKAADAKGEYAQQDQGMVTSPSTALEEMSTRHNIAPATPFPLLEEEAGATKTMLPSNHMAAVTTQVGKKRSARRKWALIAIAALLVIAANSGLFYYLFARNPSQSIANFLSTQQTITTTQRVTLTAGHQIGTTGPKNRTKTINPTAINGANLTATHGPIPTATNAPTAIPTHGPIPTATNAPTATSTSTPCATSGTTETLQVIFTNGKTPVTTTYCYNGSVTIAVSGSGEEAYNKWVDAFYEYTDANGNSITPYYTAVLWIDGGAADGYTQVPSYNSNHDYQFTIKAPAGRTLSFAIGDNYPEDNSGSLTVTVTQD